MQKFLRIFENAVNNVAGEKLRMSARHMLFKGAHDERTHSLFSFLTALLTETVELPVGYV